MYHDSASRPPRLPSGFSYFVPRADCVSPRSRVSQQWLLRLCSNALQFAYYVARGRPFPSRLGIQVRTARGSFKDLVVLDLHVLFNPTWDRADRCDQRALRNESRRLCRCSAFVPSPLHQPVRRTQRRRWPIHNSAELVTTEPRKQRGGTRNKSANRSEWWHARVVVTAYGNSSWQEVEVVISNVTAIFQPLTLHDDRPLVVARANRYFRSRGAHSNND